MPRDAEFFIRRELESRVQGLYRSCSSMIDTMNGICRRVEQVGAKILLSELGEAGKKARDIDTHCAVIATLQNCLREVAADNEA